MLRGRRIPTHRLSEPVVAPEAGICVHFYRLPWRHTHLAPAPTILDEEIRRRSHVERRHVVVVVPAERHLDSIALCPRQVRFRRLPGHRQAQS